MVKDNEGVESEGVIDLTDVEQAFIDEAVTLSMRVSPSGSPPAMFVYNLLRLRLSYGVLCIYIKNCPFNT